MAVCYAARIKKQNPASLLMCYECGKSVMSFTGFLGHIKKRKHYPVSKEYEEYFELSKYH